MEVLVTGASGLIGSGLVPALEAHGHRVRRLTRRAPSRPDEYRWDPGAGRIDAAALDAVDAAVHLAGESVAGRWTTKKKDAIRRSRVGGTRTLSEALAGLDRKPEVLISASAIGYYGDRGDELLTEESARGDGFLADVVAEWEAASRPAEDAGVRVVRLRFGIVLSPRGGALRTMLVPFRLGLGGRVGSGRQWVSWVAVDDVVGAIEHSLGRADVSGVQNTVAPNPVTNAELTATLARVLHRPAVLPVPAPAARVALGEFAQEVLASARVEPRRLAAAGYEFRQPELEGALRHLLGRPR
jgi:uncharacterized protein (TIGR01777 family)